MQKGCWEILVLFTAVPSRKRGARRREVLQLFADHDTAVAEGLVSAEELGARETFGGVPRVMAYASDAALADTLTARLQSLDGDLEVSSRFLAAETWNDVWDENVSHFTSQRFFVTTDPYLTDASKPFRLVLEPSTAFGDGKHVTTRLALELLDLVLVQKRPRSLLDVGCGNGVLAIAGVLAGVPLVRGTDIVEEALAASRRHMALNGVAFDLRHTADPFDGQCFDVVMANIPATGLIAIAKRLAFAVGDTGELIIAGFFEGDRPMVETAFKELGFSTHASVEKTGWVALGLRRG